MTEPEYEPDPWICTVGGHWVDGPSYRLNRFDAYLPARVLKTWSMACWQCYHDYTGTPEAEEPTWEPGDEKYDQDSPF